MELLIKDKKAMPVRVSNIDEMGALLNETRWKIAQELAKKADYPSNIAKRLNLDEQITYYHIRQLQAAGLISVEKTEEKQGATAKYFKLAAPAFAIVAEDRWKGFYEKRDAPPFFEDFIDNGAVNCKIIVGSPEPHGPHKARALDGMYAIDLALFLGSLCNGIVPCAKLDTEVRSNDLKDNLICVGGPVTNLIVAQFMDELPIRLHLRDFWTIVSDASGKTYTEENCGLIVKTQNPLAKGKKILVICGKKREGTRAAVLAMLKNPNMDFRNKFDKGVLAKVVEGFDVDSDGIVDEVEILE